MTKHNETRLGGTLVPSGAVARVRSKLTAGDTYEVAVPTANAVVTGAKLVVVKASSSATEIELFYGTNSIIGATAVNALGVTNGNVTSISEVLTNGEDTLSIAVTGANMTDGDFVVVLEYFEPLVQNNQFLAIKA